MTLQRLKILVSAYACQPHTGSEPGVGWNWVQQIARFHEVWVITRANNRGSIEAALAEQPIEHVHWVYFDLPRWLRFWKKGQRGVHLYYYLWQIGIGFVGQRLHRQVKFDLAHHLTFGTYWLPSCLPLLSMPFVWGPLGGGESAPRTFYSSFGIRSKLYEYVRDAIRLCADQDPLVRMDARRASVILTKAVETEQRLRQIGSRQTRWYPEAGMDCGELARLSALPIRTASPFRLVSIGRLIHLKGFHLGILAFARFLPVHPTSEYWLIGDGPERNRLVSLAQELGIADKVRFWGNLPRAQVLDLLASCDVLVHPTLHDSGGWVCLESMAAGRPVICLNLGGPAMQVTEETGFKVPARSPDQVIGDLAAAMRRLAQDVDLREHMGDNAKIRVQEHFSWELKGREIAQIYAEALIANRGRYD